MAVTLSFFVDDQVAHLVPTLWQRKLRLRCQRMLRAVAHLERVRDKCKLLPPLQMTLRLTSDDAMQQLNRRYRHKNKSTDVLAFAQREAMVPGQDRAQLGDVVISVPTALEQCKAPKAAPQLFAELLFLASHGLCHLIGYDHPNDEQEAAMNQRMANLRAEATRTGPVRPA